MKLTFKKVILLSVITVLLGVSLVYTLGLEFKPTQRGSQSTTPPPGTAPSYVSYLLIYAYNGDNQSVSNPSFVQASVTITGPENYNGTTTTDPQNPLRFIVKPGEYSVFGTYGSATPQNATVRATAGGLFDAFLNFGSSPVPPFGHILVTAWNTSIQSSGEFLSYAVQASVTIIGPEDHNGTTSADQRDSLIFTVQPGDYTVFGTYGSATSRNQTVSVAGGSDNRLYLFFGDAPFRPPP